MIVKNRSQIKKQAKISFIPLKFTDILSIVLVKSQYFERSKQISRDFENSENDIELFSEIFSIDPG